MTRGRTLAGLRRTASANRDVKAGRARKVDEKQRATDGPAGNTMAEDGKRSGGRGVFRLSAPRADEAPQVSRRVARDEAVVGEHLRVEPRSAEQLQILIEA